MPDGHKFGLYAFRSSMATWIVGIAKVDPKTAQGILRHGKISTTLDLYAQTVKDEMLSVQDKYLKTLNCGG